MTRKRTNWPRIWLATLCLLAWALRANAATGDVISVTVNPDAWYLEIVIEGIGTGGTYSTRLGLGADNTPETGDPDITLTSQDAGYVGTTPTTRNRTIWGTSPVRKPYPNQAEMDEDANGGNVKLKIALSDWIYSGRTITGSIDAGFYTSGATPNNAWSGTVTNSSTQSYWPPVCKWTCVPFQRVTGDFEVMLQAYAGESANDGLGGIAAVKFTATDSAMATYSTTVTAPSFSSFSTGDALPAPDWAGTIDVSGLADGELTVSAEVYPSFGTAAMDSTAGEEGFTTWPIAAFTDVPYYLDTGGTYARIAKVDPSSPSGTPATYTLGAYNFATAEAYASIGAALNDLRTANGTGEHGGCIVELVEDSYDWYGDTVTASSGTIESWTIVRAGPGQARASVIIDTKSGSSVSSQRIAIHGCTITANAASTFTDDAIWLHDCELNSSGSSVASYDGAMYVTHCLLTDWEQGLKPALVGTVGAPALVRGCELAAGWEDAIRVYACTGILHRVKGPGVAATIFGDVTNPSQAAPEDVGRIFSYSKILGLHLGAGGQSMGFGTTAGSGITAGHALVNLLIENVGDANAPIGNLYTATSLATPTHFENIIVTNGTFVGERFGGGYNNVAGDGPQNRRGFFWRNNYIDARGIKGDVFASDGALTGFLPWSYQVGCSGNIDAGVTDVGPSAFPADYDGLSSPDPDNSGASGYLWADFTWPRRYHSAGVEEGGGIYAPAPGSPLMDYQRDFALTFDLDGRRRILGADAIGAFSRPIVAVITNLTIP